MGLDQRLSELMRRAQDGDRRAYETLLIEVMALVRGFARRRLSQADWQDEVTQETLLSIHRDRHTYDPQRPFLPWMYAIARHRLLEFVERQRRRCRNEIPGQGLEEVSQALIAALAAGSSLAQPARALPVLEVVWPCRAGAPPQEGPRAVVGRSHRPPGLQEVTQVDPGGRLRSSDNVTESLPGALQRVQRRRGV